MNWIPARITWLLLGAVAWVLPGYSGRKALMVGWRQHAIVPGPNSGWSEAATAGALERRLIGPIWAGGQLVTDAWLGDANDLPAGEPRDFRRAAILDHGDRNSGGCYCNWNSVSVILKFLRCPRGHKREVR